MQTISTTDDHTTRSNGGPGQTAVAAGDRGLAFRILAAVAIVVAVAALVVSVTKSSGSSTSSTHDLVAGLAAQADHNAYQAVTLSNGTVYYGKLAVNGDSLVLDDVYYLTGATTQNPSGSLVKRGGEVYSPKGAMVLNPTLVLEVDNVGSDSVVVRGIQAIAKKGK